MVATKLDGTAIAKSIRERIGREIAERQKLNPRYRPSLKIVQGMNLPPRAEIVLCFGRINDVARASSLSFTLLTSC